MEDITPLAHLCKQLPKHATKLKKYSTEWVKGTAHKMFMPWPQNGFLSKAILQHMTTYLHATYTGKKLEKRLTVVELWKMYAQTKEEEPPIDWILNVCTEGGETPTAPPALPETTIEGSKDEGLYPLRELKAFTEYSNPAYESLTYSSDENQGKDKDKNLTSAVPKDKGRRDDERKDQAQTIASLDKEREGKNWKGSEDKTDEIAFAKDEWMGGQILLKLDGIGSDDVRPKERLDEAQRKEKEKELRDERIRRKDRLRRQLLYCQEQEKQLNRNPSAPYDQDRQKQHRLEEEQRVHDKKDKETKR